MAFPKPSTCARLKASYLVCKRIGMLVEATLRRQGVASIRIVGTDVILTILVTYRSVIVGQFGDEVLLNFCSR